MGTINLYKIDPTKGPDFVREISQKMRCRNTIEKQKELIPGTSENINLTLYTPLPQDDKAVGWDWVFHEFGYPSLETSPAPKAVIVIKREDESLYAVTFGHSYFLVDKYCDRDFGFNFARKLDYKEIKTTTLTTPSSHRNKTVNTYVNYSELEFDSGESFAKLKAKAVLAEGFSLYKPAIEIGSSIRFSTADESLDKLISLILHVENTVATQDDKYQIPVFSKITDTDLLLRLEARLAESVLGNPAQINISELDIIGATEIFNHNDSEFILKFGGTEKAISSLSNEELEHFCRDNNWDYGASVLNISVVSLYNGSPVVTNQIRNLIDYIDDEERCLLSKGIWYKFNDDYLSYLRDSIAEIPAEYHPSFDFTNAIHSSFINQKYQEERNAPQYDGKTEVEIKKALRKKYYAERAFNLLRSSQDNFQNFDRETTHVGGTTVEEMDLYKDGMMCAVKIGNTSAKLCYAVDQSLTALKLYKKHLLPNMPHVSTVVLWFVLERQEHIEDADGVPVINDLEMLMLKNRLDQWKKEVRLQGFKPLIYINYRTQ